MNVFSSVIDWIGEILSFVIESAEIFLINLFGYRTTETQCDVPIEQPEESFEMI
jgi:hypothetical protein